MYFSCLLFICYRIAEEFGFDENERDVKLGGMIALGFFFVGAPVSYIIGWLADCIDRTPLFAVTVFIGELGCFLVYFVQTYQQLYACRVLTGISIGGAIPIVFSVLGDLYPANQRSIVAAVVTTGSGLGMGIGQVMAGMMDDWRLPFLIVSIPGILCSFAILCFNDPPRGANEAAVLEFDNAHNNHAVATQESALSQSDILAISMAHGDHVQPLKNCGMNCDASKVRIDSECQHATTINTLNLDTVTNDNDTHITIASDAQSTFADPATNETSCKSTYDLFKTPSVLLIILQAAPGSL
jgi:MFS family permease